MTTTETAAPPRKRAPRKAAAAATPAADEPKGINSRTAESVREQLEAATGEQVTAGAVRRLRGGVTGYKVTRPAGELTPAERRDDDGRLISATTVVVDDVSHPDDPGPAAPGLEDDPDAAGQTVDLVAGTATRTARETAPPAGAGDQVDQVLAAADLTEEDREAIAEHADQLLALADADDPSPTAPPAELPADVTACGPGTPTVGDVATIATFAADLERLAATRAAADARLRTAGPLGEAFADDMAEQLADEAELDLRTLVAVDLGGPVDFDLSTLVAGHVTTAPDGRRVTVLDQPARPAADVFDAAAFTAMRQAYDDTHVDTATGEILLEGGDPTRVKLSAELAAASEEARALEARAGELKEAAEAIRAQIREALGGEDGRGEVALAPDGTELARWTRVTSTKCSTTALKKADPDTWARYATTTVSRRFTWAD